MNWLEVTPAYGKDYKSQKAVKEDWAADKDFRDTVSGSYINKSGADKLGLSVIVRYGNGLKVMSIPFKK